MPLAYDLDALRRDLSLLEQAPSRFDTDRADTRFLLRLLPNVASMFRVARNIRRLTRTADADFEKKALPAFREYVAAKRRQDLGRLSDGELAAELRAREERVMGDFGAQALLPGFLGGMALASLTRKLTMIAGGAAGEAMACALTTALQGDTTWELNAALQAMAAGKQGEDEFLEAYGHRCAGEMELAVPRWREDPGVLRAIVAARGRSDPSAARREGEARRAAAEAGLPAWLAEHGAASLLAEVARDLSAAQRLLPYRERGKHFLMMGFELLRAAVEELARRRELGNRVYYLRWDELDRDPRADPGLSAELDARRASKRNLQRLEMPDVIDPADLEAIGRPRTIAFSNEVTGAPVAAGVATGVARTMLEPADAAPGEGEFILVCPSADPGWAPLFLSACGLIVERGGMLSHAAIVARDAGIPAVVYPDATRAFPSGTRLRLDGNTGRISVLKEAGAT
jgi:pyruvate,water dikinase